ncbi:MAG: nitrate reductase subunit beta [Geobacter sp.]|nr:nitrate reductase subunit beta [Geobacter sp.]
MNVRSQLVMVFNLDKCIGCHTCSIACKNIWTDRQGAEYMWWNNVETKPGIGYPKNWEDQEHYKGGWINDGGELRLKGLGKGPTLLNMFFQPNMPAITDYYEPFDVDYASLHGAPKGDDQPTADIVSQISGQKMEEVTSGPNWDDDLSGSGQYAANDPNLADASIIEDYGRIFMQYLPRLCNHCLNPACAASCPSRAIYKRGEDGVVLVDQNVCKGWRFCTSACPYKKVYYNWTTGKAEKCIFCFPRTETGQCNACSHSCVGRIRYLGVLLYDADGVEQALKQPDDKLVEAQRALILDPHDPAVQHAARKNNIPDHWLDAACNSPAYTLVKEQGMALPLHAEFRTMPMAYYIPSLSPVIAKHGDLHEVAKHGLIPALEQLRVPLDYLASLLGGGNQQVVAQSLAKLIALRVWMRAKNLGETADPTLLAEAGLDETSATKLYRLFTVASYRERSIIPGQQRESEQPYLRKGGRGFGVLKTPRGGV